VNVQKLNKDGAGNNQDSFKSLLLLEEISKGEPLSQRDLSKRLDIALGLVNSYIRNLVAKGYVTIRNIPAKRYTYYLTPKGFTEKTRLTYQLLHDYTNLYRNARKDFQKLFQDLQRQGVRTVVFAGVDEIAEIAYLSLQEVDIQLLDVFDNEKAGSIFLRKMVKPLSEFNSDLCRNIILTSYVLRESVMSELLSSGINRECIHTIHQASS
jgi:DNA-binding MarR family transcriptional regulator